MPAGDILTIIDLGPGLGESRLPNVERTSSTAADSEYRRALSRSLGKESRRSAQSENSAPASDTGSRLREPEETSNSPRYAHGPEQSSTSPTRSTSAADAAHRRESSDSDRVERDEATRRKDLDVDAGDQDSKPGVHSAAVVSTDLVLPAGSQLNAESFSVGEEALSPPPGVALLFGAAADDAELRQDVGAGFPTDAGLPAPPAGLFESLVTSVFQDANASPSVPGLTAAATGAVDGGDVVNEDATEIELSTTGDGADGSDDQPGLPDAPAAEEFAVNVELVDPGLSANGASQAGDPANAATGLAVAETAIRSAAGSQTDSDRGAGQSAGHRTVGGATQVAFGQTSLARSFAGNDPGATASGGFGQTAQPSSNSAASATAASSSSPSGKIGQSSQPPPSNSAAHLAGPAALGPQHTGPAAQSLAVSDVDPAEFVDRLANTIRLAEKNGQQLRISLRPPHLGSLHVEVTSRGGALSVTLEVQTASAHHAILENLSLLREALAHHGAAVDRIDVQLADPTQDNARPNLGDHAHHQQSEQQSHPDADEQLDAQQDDDTTRANDANGDELDIQV